MYFLGCKGLLNDDIEGAGGTVYQEIRPGAGFKTPAISLKKVGGASVERFYYTAIKLLLYCYCTATILYCCYAALILLLYRYYTDITLLLYRH